MSNSNKIDVYSSPEALEITFKWFSPKAIFMAVFCTFWFGFLAFWYFIAFSTGGPLIMKLFPILHVLAGLAVLYSTLCMFLNKTYVDVRDNYLTVTHKPIPWYKGSLDVPADELKQLYVSQKTHRGKNGVSYSYILNAKRYNGTDIEVLAIPELTSLQLKQIEEYIENHIGIEDEPVKGEYQSAQPVPKSESARKQRRAFSDSNFAPLYFLKNGDAFTIKGEDLDLINVTQYDWSDGNTDKYFQFVNYQKQEQLIYVEQNLSLLNAFSVKKLSLLDVGNFVFNQKVPEDSIEYLGNEYLLVTAKQGKKFVSTSQRNFNTKKWVYKSKDESSSIQVVASEKTIQYSLLTMLAESDVESNLNLDEFPEREIDYRSNELDDEDFV